jgi:hypothetical protein
VKAFQTLDDGGLVYYSDEETGFTVSVERLLCVDGWEDSTKKQAMTLIVLKVMVASNSAEKISSVVARLELVDTKKGEKAKPDVEAWAPFKNLEKSNETQAQVTTTYNANAQAGGSGGGATATISAGYEYEISWTQSYFDEGHAYPVMSTITGRRSGVRWVLKANPQQRQGVPPEMFVGILLKREKQVPYLLKFDIRVKGGLLHDLKRGIEKVLGLGPGCNKPYLVRPSSTPVTRYEGEYMLQRVHSDKLGDLRAKGDPTNLTLVWKKEMPPGSGNAVAEAENEADKNKAQENPTIV